MEKINVTKTFLPPIEEYQRYVQQIWDKGQITNQGPLLHEFQQKIAQYLGVKNFHFVANGTIALQIALMALGIEEGEIITTPFSYVATTSAIIWQRCQPVFVDIDPDTLCLDPSKIEAAITPRTRAIIPVHVFGHPCDTDQIDQIAKKHNLKVIYDAAHAFGVQHGGKALPSYGDIATLSFHATKPFHTVEGGGIIVQDDATSEKVELIKRFGHQHDEHFMLGINAKASELHAAMGLANLPHFPAIIDGRKHASNLYDKHLASSVQRPSRPTETYNYAYYPVILKDEAALQKILDKLSQQDIFPRRYFYPSLNTLSYLQGNPQSCPISEDISRRILCLPLYDTIPDEIVMQIIEVVNGEA